MKRTIWIILAILVSLTWARAPAAAQSTGPTMRVTVGFDGYCHTSSWCPVYVVLSNEGADIEGELRITNGANEADVYACRVALPVHSRKGYLLYVPPDDSSSRLTVQLLAEKEALSSQQVTVSWLNEQARLYGIASGDPSALNFLNDVTPVGWEAAVAHLDLETLPSNALIWEGLDVLILNDVDTTLLSGEQRRALETWVAHGGHLIVGGGAGAARTISGVTDLLPVAVGGTRSVDDLWALNERLDATLAPGPYAVAETVLRDGKALIEQEDLILLARRDYGAGKVDFLAFDAGLNPFVRWDDNARLWESIVGTRGVGARGLAVRNGYSARDAVNAIPGLRVPSTLHILAFMFVYTLLIGPVNYVILRKMDRRELAWLTIPILIAGFTGCAYLTGFQLRGTVAIMHRLAAVYVPQGAEVGRVSQVVGLFSPRRANHDVWVADAAAREIPDSYYGVSEGQSLRIVEEAGGMTVDDLRVDVGGIQSFAAEGYADAPPVWADLRLVSDATGGLRLEGTVRSGDLALKEAVLVMGGGEQRLGDLDAGAEFNISLDLCTSFSSSYDNMPERIIGPGNYWDDQTLYRRHQFLQALFPHGEPSRLAEGAYLVGWVEEGVPLPVEVVGRPASTVEMALYVYELSVAGLEAEGQITIGPELITRQMENSTGYVDVWPDGCHIDSGAEVEFRFTVWPGVTVSQVDELVVDMQTSGDPSHPPAIALWNWESGAWEEFDFGWGRHSVPDAGAYVLPPGESLLRLTAQADWPVSMDILTITIKGQR